MVRDGKATSFEIMIDEAQRVALLKVIAHSAIAGVVPEALEYWIDMLEGLPANELESPNVTHGFCL